MGTRPEHVSLTWGRLDVSTNSSAHSWRRHRGETARGGPGSGPGEGSRAVEAGGELGGTGAAGKSLWLSQATPGCAGCPEGTAFSAAAGHVF